ncbi:hypothetical protein F3K02_09210 [Hydrogenophaga sp. D2P1]|uniref:Morphogenetic protein n=1 Tax=Hydrogenophaga aromaticivorans TaxID=2610898 RepID=A0A7Y8GV54_9BURK|nr:hypothetical protein [Hydrogenophaga aromaticivorans]NWF45424.1 hypothetical protein [Hydrogenophaga aromaticivorans]
MKERPILFSKPMVLALLSGTKTQTRRVVKPSDLAWMDEHQGLREPDNAIRCPYGQPGDHLWVRETFFAWGRWETRFSAKKGRDEWHFIDMTLECGQSYLYAADGVSDTKAFIKRRGGVEPMYWKRPAIFMPRAACRITLELTGVRVDRLQDISEADAKAEGIHQQPTTGWFSVPGISGAGTTARAAYALLWNSINGAGSWDSNPWVWCVEFKRTEVA